MRGPRSLAISRVCGTATLGCPLLEHKNCVEVLAFQSGRVSPSQRLGIMRLSYRNAFVRGGPSACWRKNPIEGQNPQKPGFRYFAAPAASRAFAGQMFIPKDFHGFILGEGRLRALPLQIDV